MTAYTEPINWQTPRSATLKLYDATGTPHTFQVRYASLDITQGGHTVLRAMDESGDYIGPPRKGGQAGVSTVSITGKLWGAGGSTASLHLLDIITDTGTVQATMASSQADTELHVWDKLVLQTATAGTFKGASYLLNDVVVEPGSKITKTEEGFDISVTFSSDDPIVTITEN